MKRTLMAFLFSYALAQPCPCQEKSCMVGVGLTSFTRGCAEIIFSYGFGSHWSVTAETSISYKGLTREVSPVELEHTGEFTAGTAVLMDPDLHCERIIFNWWPTKTLHGFSLSAGIQNGSSTGLDIITEAGYTFQIWKGLCISTGVRFPLLIDMPEDGIHSHNIKVGINYRF